MNAGGPRVDERRRGIRKALAGGEQATADQEHDVRSIEVKHLRDSLQGHPAGRHGNARAEVLPRRTGGVCQLPADFGRVAEAPAVIGEDHRVGAEQTKQLAQEQRGREPGRAGHCRVRHERHRRILPGQRVQSRKPDDHRRHQHRFDAHFRCKVQLPAKLIEIARQAGDVAGPPASGGGRLLHGRGAGAHPRVERAVLLIGQTMVVLDEVEATAREAARKIAQRLRREALWLQRRARHGASFRTHPVPQLLKPVVRSAERRDHLLRQADILQRDIGMDRGIAEQHVEELPRLTPDGRCGESDPHAENAVAKIFDRLDAPDDFRQHERIVDSGNRHLNTLLDSDGRRARLDL